MSPKKPVKKKKMKKQTVWLALGSAGILAVAAWIFIGGSNVPLTASGAKLVQTMDPHSFSNDPRAQAAYQVAKDMPEVLAELPCFCGCMTAFGHESNLFCFRDSHGAGCEVCEGIEIGRASSRERV